MKFLRIFILLSTVAHAQSILLKTELGWLSQTVKTGLETPLIINTSDFSLRIENKFSMFNSKPYFGIGPVYSNSFLSLGLTTGMINFRDDIFFQMKIDDASYHKVFYYNTYFPYLKFEFHYVPLEIKVLKTNYRIKPALNIGAQYLFPSFFNNTINNNISIETSKGTYLVQNTAFQNIYRYNFIGILGLKFILVKEKRNVIALCFNYSMSKSYALWHMLELVAPNTLPTMTYFYFSNGVNSNYSLGLEVFFGHKRKTIKGDEG